MGKAQTFDIIAVSIPDSNVQMAVARIMVGADRYLSMQAALERVKAPPVLLFKNTELKDAEQHIAKLKALGVGFRVVRADGTDDDSIMRDDDLPGAPGKAAGAAASAAGQALSDILTPGAAPPIVSVRDAISHHHSDPHGAHAHAGGHTGADVGGFGSADGVYGGAGGSGIRAGAPPSSMAGTLESLRKSEAASLKKNRWISIATAAAVVVGALLFYIVPKGNKFRVNKITIPGVAAAGGAKRQAGPPNAGGDGESEAAGGGPSGAPERQTGGGDKPRNSVNSQQKQQANNYVDSAKTGGTELDKQVAFYKIAISFNRYNLQAWHGLLQAYREMNKAEDARATEAQMLEIFGKEVNSVNSAVTQFGEIIDAYTNEGGAYRVEYKTKKSSKEEILRDVFNLTRAVRNACNCHNISVYASTGPGNGLMVHSTAATSVHTLPEFSQQASILWFD